MRVLTNAQCDALLPDDLSDPDAAMEHAGKRWYWRYGIDLVHAAGCGDPDGAPSSPYCIYCWHRETTGREVAHWMRIRLNFQADLAMGPDL